MDGVIVWRFLFCGIFCWIKREFTSFKVWSWSALPRLAQGTPSASTNALWLVIFGTLRKIFTCNTFLLQNPMARHRQRCLRHTMDFGVRSFSPSILDPFIPSYDFYGSERNIYFLYGHWHYILTSKDLENEFLINWQIEKCKNDNMMHWMIDFKYKDAIGAGSDCADCVCWVNTNHKHYHYYHFGFPMGRWFYQNIIKSHLSQVMSFVGVDC